MRSGEIIKSASSLATESELALINKYTRRAFTAEEVYVFSVVLCDNDIDRDFERFTVETLFELEKLFVGKTGISDHNPLARNQTARIFECRVEALQGRKTANGDDYFRLAARAYLPRSPKNEELITQLDSGILKEVSVGCAVDRAVCSICGSKKGTPCGHVRGESYDGKICFVELSKPVDAYEWSFVAVPAQRNAGVIKSFTQNSGKENEIMKELIKSLGDAKDITLCAKDAFGIFEYVRELEQKAHEGEQYRQELTREIIGLAAVAEPNISQKTMEKAVSALDLTQLKEFTAAYKKKKEDVLTVKPQLAPDNSAARSGAITEFKM